MKSINEIEVYEVNGKEVEIGESRKMLIESHWNRDAFVILKFGKTNVTVTRSALDKAISNATNV